jgi:hypothetical protein
MSDSAAFEFYLLTFQNTMSILPAYPAYEDGTECTEALANTIHAPGNHPN